MDMKDNKELEEILNETDALSQSTALNKIVLKLLKDTKAENFRLWLALLVFMIFTFFLVIFMHLTNVEQQNKFIETQNAYLKYLNNFEFEVVEEYSEAIENGYEEDETEVIQENNNGNNVYQAGDNATYNQ